MKCSVLFLFITAAAAQQQNSNSGVAVRLAQPGFFQNYGAGSRFNNFNQEQLQQQQQFQTINNQRNQFQGNFQNNNAGNFRQNQNLVQTSFANQNQQSSFRSSENNNNFQSRTFRNQFNTAQNPSQSFRNQRFGQNNLRSVEQSRFSNNRFGDSEVFRANLFNNNNNNNNQFNVQSRNVQPAFRAVNFQSTSTNSQNQNSNNFLDRSARFRSTNNVQQESRNFVDNTSPIVDFGIVEPLNLPSGAQYLLGSVDTSFSCVNRPYGYYADQDNSCRVFHVCNPSLFSDGRVETYQYSFMCGEGSIFDQDRMTCINQYEASPCEEAQSYYFRNEEFGLPQEQKF